MADNRLKEWDPNQDCFEDSPPDGSNDILETDNNEEKLEKIRRKAFIEDATQFGDAAFWKNYIESKSKARKLQQKTAGKRKRSPLLDSDDMIVREHGRASSFKSSGKRPRSGNSAVHWRTSHLQTPGPTPTNSGQDLGTSSIRLTRMMSEEMEISTILAMTAVDPRARVIFSSLALLITVVKMEMTKRAH